MAEWTILHLRKDQDRSAFSCGNASLDSFLRQHAMQYEKRGLARTYVAVESNADRVAGYYTLSSGSLELSDLPKVVRKKLPKHRVPTYHLGRLAVDTAYRGRRLGETLLIHALKTSLEAAQVAGIFGVDVWAIDDDAHAFYVKYHFMPLEDDPHHLLLSLRTFETAFNL